MQVKPKICKGTNKAIGHGCGESKYIHRFGLCSKCFGTWLYSTDSGNELLEKSTIKGKKIVDQKEKKQWKERKEKTKTLPDWKKDLQKEINLIARIIDYGHPCLARNYYPKQLHGGHVYSVKSNDTIRFNLHNVHRQSAQSNHFQNDDGLLREGLQKEYGMKYFDFVSELRQIKSLNLSKLEYKELHKKAYKIALRLKKTQTINELSKRIELRNEINLELGIYKPEYCVFNI